MDAEGRAYDRSEPGSGPTPIYMGPERDAREGWRRNTPVNIDELVQRMQEVEEAKADD